MKQCNFGENIKSLVLVSLTTENFVGYHALLDIMVENNETLVFLTTTARNLVRYSAYSTKSKVSDGNMISLNSVIYFLTS